MAEKKVILVTGVSGYWGSQVAAALNSPSLTLDGADFQVIGLDTEPPPPEIRDLDFVQADIRNPLLHELLQSEKVHTVVHLLFAEGFHPSEASFDINVIGTMKLLGACAESGVQKVVLRSSMAVYGAHPNNPAFLTEQHPLQGSRSFGYARDMLEIEAFCNGFRRQAPEMILTLLRFSSIIGTKGETALTRFLKEPFAPVLLGFDPQMQVIHEKDVVRALVHSGINDAPGVFNVAAEGVLPLSRILSLAAKIPIPLVHLFAYWGDAVVRSAGLRGGRYFPFDLDYIRYSWVGDLEKMRSELNFVPQYTAEEALREFAGDQRLRRYMPEIRCTGI